MLRQELVEAATSLFDFLNSARIREFIEKEFLTSPRRSRDDDDEEGSRRKGSKNKYYQSEVFEKFHLCRQFLDASSEATKELIGIFELNQIFESEFWAQLVESEGPTPQIFSARSDLYFATEKLPLIIALLNNKEEEAAVLSVEEMSSMECFINEDGADLIRLSSLVVVFEALEDLFEDVALIEQEAKKEIFLWRMDSGSKKYFSIVGAKKLVNLIKEAIIEIWDRIRFAEAKEFEANCKAAIEGCKLIKQVGELEKKGVLTTQQAVRTKKNITKSLNRLFDKGVYIEEMKHRASLSVKQITSSDIKLIEYASKPANELGATKQDDAQK